ncbi:MAG: hypothetical protein ACRDRA_06290 [Pseudonocardiaceae bacterium]
MRAHLAGGPVFGHPVVVDEHARDIATRDLDAVGTVWEEPELTDSATHRPGVRWPHAAGHLAASPATSKPAPRLLGLTLAAAPDPARCGVGARPVPVSAWLGASGSPEGQHTGRAQAAMNLAHPPG